MPLLLPLLITEFAKVFYETNPLFVGWPPTTLAGINNIVTAYENYARYAIDISTDVLLVYNKPGFIAALSTLTPGVSYLDAANAFQLGFQAFWMGAQFAILIPPTVPPPPPLCTMVGTIALEATSIITAVDVLNTLTPLLLAEFSDVTVASMYTKAVRLATIFHIATITTVMCTIIGPPPPAVPTGINICTIF
jgi:hypothetical protein